MRAALRAGLGFPNDCGVGGCGNCRFEPVLGEIETLWAEAPGLSERERRRGRRLACQSRPNSDCVIKVRLADEYRPAIPAARLTATLTAMREIAPGMGEFVFRTEAPARFLAGQFAILHPPGVEGARAYSMSNLPNGEGEWRFVVRRTPGGRGSNAMFNSVRVGEALVIDGPYGRAYWRTTTHATSFASRAAQASARSSRSCRRRLPEAAHADPRVRGRANQGPASASASSSAKRRARSSIRRRCRPSRRQLLARRARLRPCPCRGARLPGRNHRVLFRRPSADGRGDERPAGDALARAARSTLTSSFEGSEPRPTDLQLFVLVLRRRSSKRGSGSSTAACRNPVPGATGIRDFSRHRYLAFGGISRNSTPRKFCSQFFEISTTQGIAGPEKALFSRCSEIIAAICRNIDIFVG